MFFFLFYVLFRRMKIVYCCEIKGLWFELQMLLKMNIQLFFPSLSRRRRTVYGKQSQIKKAVLKLFWSKETFTFSVVSCWKLNIVFVFWMVQCFIRDAHRTLHCNGGSKHVIISIADFFFWGRLSRLQLSEVKSTFKFYFQLKRRTWYLTRLLYEQPFRLFCLIVERVDTRDRTRQG